MKKKIAASCPNDDKDVEVYMWIWEMHALTADDNLVAMNRDSAYRCRYGAHAATPPDCP